MVACEVSKQPPWSMATSTSTAPGFIVASIVRVTSLGAAAPGTSTAPMTASAEATSSATASLVDVAGADAAAEEIVELAQARQRAVEDGDLGAEADGHARRMGADDAAADDHDLGRGDAGNAAEQDAAAAIRLLQRRRRGLDRQAAGDLAHRREQRQAAVRVGHGLIGDGGDARCHQAAGLRRHRGRGGDR